MKADDYLGKILESQTIRSESQEMKDLQTHREVVEKILRREFGNGPTIRYGGSKSKGTMITESYDLDILCYFPHGDMSAGKSLKEIFDNVHKVLSSDYFVTPKRSALRLQAPKTQIDFHIDVVPGRFVDDADTDANLHQNAGDKDYLKTNIQTHIDHIKGSGVVEAIRLVKLWRCRKSACIKTFVLELLVVDLLKGKKNATLSDQLEHVWTEFKDNKDSLSVEDPANPHGNDLTILLDDSVKAELSSLATATLGQIVSGGWETVFGEVPQEKNSAETVNILRGAASKVAVPSKPWSKD